MRFPHQNECLLRLSQCGYTISSPNFSRAAMGSEPGDRMKMRGAQQWLSEKAVLRLKGGGSMKGWPTLSETNSCTIGTIWGRATSSVFVTVKQTHSNHRRTDLVGSETSDHHHLLKLGQVILPHAWEWSLMGVLQTFTAKKPKTLI